MSEEYLRHCDATILESRKKIIFSLLITLGSMISQVQGGHTIEKFDHTPGIYFERIGKMCLSNRVYTIAVTTDLTPLGERAEQVMTKLYDAKALCIKAGLNGYSFGLIVEQWIEDFANTRTFIRGLLGLGEVSNSRRRLTNGSTKSLFGTVDAEDTLVINERLSPQKSRPVEYFRTTGRQIEMVNSTSYKPDRAEETIQENEAVLLNTIERANRRIDEGIDQLAIRADMREHFMMVEAIMNGVIRDAERIKQLTFQGKMLDSEILTETQIIAILKKAQLPQGFSFPVEIKMGKMYQLQEISTISAQQFGNKIVTLIKIPLVTGEVFDVFLTHGIPVRTTDEFYSYLQPDNELLVIHGLTEYISMTAQQLSDCKRLQEQYICTKIFPVQLIGSYSPCEVQMYLNPKELPQTCIPKHLPLKHLLLIPMRSSNTWLYVAPRKEPITITCEREKKVEALQETGILRVEDFCEVATLDVTIRGRETSGVQTDVHFHPKLNLTVSEENEVQLQKMWSKSSSEGAFKKVVHNVDELKGLQFQLNDEKQKLDRADVGFSYGKFFTDPSSLLFGALLLMLMIMGIIMFCWCRQPTRTLPTPNAKLPPIKS